MNLRVLVGLGIAVLWLGTGCSQNSSPSTEPSSLPFGLSGSSPTASVLVPDISDMTPAPEGMEEDFDGMDEYSSVRVEHPEPTGNYESAVTIADTVMRLFIRRDVPKTQWINDLSVYLTDEAARAYDTVDPRNVPPLHITGPARSISTDTNRLAKVQIPTDKGEYLIELVRYPDQPEWAVTRIMPPEGLN